MFDELHFPSIASSVSPFSFTVPLRYPHFDDFADLDNVLLRQLALICNFIEEPKLPRKV
jgi:hypothetical protein